MAILIPVNFYIDTEPQRSIGPLSTLSNLSTWCQVISRILKCLKLVKAILVWIVNSVEDLLVQVYHLVERNPWYYRVSKIKILEMRGSSSQNKVFKCPWGSCNRSRIVPSGFSHRKSRCEITCSWGGYSLHGHPWYSSWYRCHHCQGSAKICWWILPRLAFCHWTWQGRCPVHVRKLYGPSLHTRHSTQRRGTWCCPKERAMKSCNQCGSMWGDWCSFQTLCSLMWDSPWAECLVYRPSFPSQTWGSLILTLWGCTWPCSSWHQSWWVGFNLPGGGQIQQISTCYSAHPYQSEYAKRSNVDPIRSRTCHHCLQSHALAETGSSWRQLWSIGCRLTLFPSPFWEITYPSPLSSSLSSSSSSFLSPSSLFLSQLSPS